MSGQSVEEFYEQVRGSVEAVVLAFGALAATHPEKETVMAVVNTLGKKLAADTPSDTVNLRSYKLGIRTAVAQLVKSVETAQLAAEILAVKRQTGSH